MKFSDFNLKPEIMSAIDDLGYENPTPIQEATLSKLVENQGDFIALAQTGTGKTAAFSIPILQNIDLDSRDVQAFILSPTRELALQITRDLISFGSHMPKLKVQAVYGGASIRDQISGLKSEPQIVVGTPGRVLDMINKGKLKVDSIKWLVLDEADEMLSMGFKDELDAILVTTPSTRQTYLFSATMPSEVKHIAKNYMNSPETISVGAVNTSNKNIEHQYYLVDGKNKYQALKMLVDSNPDVYAIIFCKTRIDTQEIADMLGQDGYNADALHGDLAQGQRDFVMGKFKSGQLQILVATDVAARGLDVSDLTHVINFSLPDDPEVYIHRTGRTGRAGKSGIAMSIITKKEQNKILAIERMIKNPVTYMQVPNGELICEAQLLSLIKKVKAIDVDEETITPFMKAVNEAFEDMDKAEVLKKFISIEFNRFLAYYKNLKNVNAIKDSRDDRGRGSDRDRSGRGERDRGGRDRDRDRGGDSRSGDNNRYSVVRLNHGKASGLNPKSLIKFINDLTPGKKVILGNIDIDRDHSSVEVRQDQVPYLIDAATKSNMRGVVITEIGGGASPNRRPAPSSEPRFDRPKAKSKSKPYDDKKIKKKFKR